MGLFIHNAKFKLDKNHHLNLPHFSVKPNQYWVIVGGNGSGKTVFSLALQNKLLLESGAYSNQFQQIQAFSFEKQRRILETILKNLNNDDTDPLYFGKKVLDIILNGSDNIKHCEEIANKLGIRALLDRFFIKLSTGELRKVLFAQALLNKPDLLILDEPFEGLDQQSVKDWMVLLDELKSNCAIILIVNRLSDIPKQATHLAMLDNLDLILQGERQKIEIQSIYQQLVYAEKAINVTLPESALPLQKLPQNHPHFELKNVVVKYGDNIILDHLNWTVNAKQNWWIKGPNGAGKSTLLSLITGDHPQAFSNEVKIFGKLRGSGETIWDIKQKIGYVNSQLHLDYRVNCAVLDVIISGFFDSIGVYQKVSDAIRLKAMHWLERLNLATLARIPFRSLSWGQQRLLLIARAMVKHPPVLILDEPFQGLDGLNRKLVKHFIEQLVNNSDTQLLFVSHQDQDAPNCITHLFEFVKENGQYSYIQSAL
ncbi:molybdate ABC transporter ATP-binding protein ModF [Rodentibacter sp. Ppn85]|uniref:molybdate ABC transporter ATP-binding protein ModF n=1 Tax=Rodentibacter sp. Ppn85 TaxID=1908525 RepID=UPI0009864D13|nr:molybdate ABC transporter ATP-binding protein ModF [Rodentibacter sp. Ppn85]OOF65574.1 molybdate ABC transporter ATP-binding protein ModF [Rodentibacter sp. Ppn85]